MNIPGSSHKARAARYILDRALAEGKIIPGQTTVIEKTGGNFGFGLALACADLHIPVELAVGLSFSAVKRRCLELFGASLIGIDALKQGSTPREVVEWHLANARGLGKSYFYTDQFNNPANVLAHEIETGPEIIDQLEAWPELEEISFVGCAGTGAHLTGITRALRGDGYRVNAILVEPAGCDSKSGIFVSHKLEGCAVGVKPPVLDWELIDETIHVDESAMLYAQRQFATKHGFFIGNTSAACASVAASIQSRTSRHHKILTIAYDHGLWYV